MIRSGPHLSKRCVSNTTKIVQKNNLPASAYKPGIVEKNTYDKWDRKGLFKANKDSEKTTYSIVLPPPNVTGKLHLGHALSSTIQDVIVRRKRSQGFNVSWLPGTDHAGIATQVNIFFTTISFAVIAYKYCLRYQISEQLGALFKYKMLYVPFILTNVMSCTYFYFLFLIFRGNFKGVVEKHLRKKNISRHDMGREEFNKEVWRWKEKHGNTICEQLRTLGCSLDWSREIFTMDKSHTHAVNTAFINLFKKGLIYRKKALVNWCNALKSTVSDIEVDNVSVNGPTDIYLPNYEKPVKFGLIYNFAYKILDSHDEIIVSTTMPETMLGDTAIAVHPDDHRYNHLKGKRAVHPFRETTIPIILDKFVDMKFGTGVVKITPAHSKLDYLVAKQNNLDIIQVINEEGIIQNAGKFYGLHKYEGREKMVAALKDLGLLKSINSHQMTLPMCSRTGDVIEYIPKEQWFLSCSKLNEMAIKVVHEKQLNIEPEKFVKNWFNWTGDDKDWCISRQLWWGHQIPAYKCIAKKNVVWIAAKDNDNAKIEASKYLRVLPEEVIVERDTDVLDTWFSSGIYPFAALGWPDCKEDFKNFYPLNLMVTGHDILGFWVHRMVILGLELTNQLPFHNVLLHGIICDSKGMKMSKSKGNVIDPIDVITGISMENLRKKIENMHRDGLLSINEVKRAKAYHKSNFSNTDGIPECGVDALRFTLLTQDIKSHFVNFDVSQCFSNKLFCNKIWQSIKYVKLSFDKLKDINIEITVDDLTSFDRWILSKLSHMVDSVNTALDNYNFHVATQSLKTFIYHEFCDVYLESTKPGFESDNVTTGYAHAHTLSAALNTSLRCLSPFMIYVTDELIPKIPDFETNIIHNFKDNDKEYFNFPKSEDFTIWKNEDIEKRIEKVLSVIYLIRELRGYYNMSNKLKPTVYVKTTDETLIKDMEDNRQIILNLSGINVIEINKNIEKTVVNSYVNSQTEVSVEIVSDNVEKTISVAREKLQKRVRKLEQNLTKLEFRLFSVNYINSVPESTQLIDRQTLNLQKEELKRMQRLI